MYFLIIFFSLVSKQEEEKAAPDANADPAKQVNGVWQLTGNSFKDRVAKGTF